MEKKTSETMFGKLSEWIDENINKPLHVYDDKLMEPKTPDTSDGVKKGYVDAQTALAGTMTTYGTGINQITNIGNSVLTTTLPPVTYNYTIASGMPFNGISMGGGYIGGGGGTGMASSYAPTEIVSIKNPTNSKEIVKITFDGEVEWADGFQITEAAEAFAKTIYLATEQKAGITERTKHKIRDSMFQDLIEIATQKGSLTAEDLTYLLQAAKMVEKLKGL